MTGSLTDTNGLGWCRIRFAAMGS